MNLLNPIQSEAAQADQQNRAMVRYWLYFICVLVAAMVIVGGATRLTDSGLSITEWKPLLGIFPPLSAADWQAEFEKYKLIPQYTQINQGMSLDEFRFIYWWEWGHRFLGRIIGFVFAVPLIFFWVTKRLEPGLKPRLLLLLALGGLQGFVGWWMVSSGLVQRTDVSQYRLAIHLILACMIFAYGFWLARGLVPQIHDGSHKILRMLAPIMVIYILFQIFLGALVAGLNAGLAFNDWPLMDGKVVPDSLLVMEPAWLNFFENPKMVQFTHRMSAYVLVGLIVLNFLVSLKPVNDRAHERRALILTLIVVGQTGLGILTLVWQVPLNMALFHQGGAIILLGLGIANWRALQGELAPIDGTQN